MENDLLMRLDKAFLTKYAQRRTVLNRHLREVGEKYPGRLAQEQASVILSLSSYGHGVAVSDIAGETDLPHANITRTLDRLEKKGIIRRTRDKTDRRQVIVRLTLEGGKIARKLELSFRKIYAAIWNAYSDGEKDAMIDLLTR